MHPLEHEITAITEQYQLGNISAEEKNYLLQEIRDIRAAQADRKSTRLNSSHIPLSRMPSSA